MKHIIVDASSNEVYVRCYDTGKIISPKELSISGTLLKSLRAWLKKSEKIIVIQSGTWIGLKRPA